jgi:hypothetical protein
LPTLFLKPLVATRSATEALSVSADDEGLAAVLAGLGAHEGHLFEPTHKDISKIANVNYLNLW